MSPEGFLVTKRWRKRQPTLSSPAQPCSLSPSRVKSAHITPARHLKAFSVSPASTISRPLREQVRALAHHSDPSPSIQKPGPCLPTLDLSCQSSITPECHAIRATTVHDFLESLQPRRKGPKRPSKKVKRMGQGHLSRQKVSQHAPKLPPLIFEDENCIFRPQSRWSKIRSNTKYGPVLGASEPDTPLPSSDEIFSSDLSSFKPLSCWKEKIEAASSIMQEPIKKKLKNKEDKKISRTISHLTSRKRAVFQKTPSKTWKELDIVDVNDSHPRNELETGTWRSPPRLSNINRAAFKPVSKLTTVHQTAQCLSSLVELPMESSPVESEPITSSPPRDHQFTRLTSMADSIICSPKSSWSRVSRSKSGKRGAVALKDTHIEIPRTLDLRSDSIDEEGIEWNASTQSNLRAKRLILEEPSTRQSIEPLGRAKKQPTKTSDSRPLDSRCAPASGAMRSSRIYSRSTRNPSFSAEKILEKLLPIASQVSNLSQSGRSVDNSTTLEKPSSFPEWENGRGMQPYGRTQKICPSLSVVRRTKSILRHHSISTTNTAENNLLTSGKLRRRMTVTFDDRHTIFESPPSTGQLMQRKLSQVILPPSSISIPTSVLNTSLSSSPVQTTNSKPVRRLSNLLRSFSTTSSSAA